MRISILILSFIALIAGVQSQSLCANSTAALANNTAIVEAQKFLNTTETSCNEIQVDKTNSTQCSYNNETYALSCACVKTYTNESLTNYTTIVTAAAGRVCLLDLSFSLTGYVNVTNTTAVKASVSITQTGAEVLEVGSTCNNTEIRDLLNQAAVGAVGSVGGFSNIDNTTTLNEFIIVVKACDVNVTVVGTIANGTATVINNSTQPIVSSTGTNGNSSSSSSSSSGTPGNTTSSTETGSSIPSNSSSSSSGTANISSSSSSSSGTTNISSSSTAGNGTQPGVASSVVATPVVMVAIIMAALLI